ncbi:flagellar hook-length control protein FliK [Rhizobacter sp. Root1221]|uniref:flagellar hook-length control protein FliK n=1 Tax=Rhizobacter sp. Root1221 TaxID=1736433 RepID=UPI0006F893C2|nr:flagellar hook-length control protein FliK [Rhizobacter sp. Root1221]KQV83055.1 hypothetical protein ASC87_08955 [Rhizobacter sp. Root1221]
MTAAVSTPALPSTNLAAALSAPPAPVRGAGFAQMLDARRAEAPPEPAPADKPKAEDTSAADNAQATRTADEARGRQLRANRQAGTRPQPADGAPVREPRAPAEMAETEPVDAPVSAAEETDPAVDPSLAEWLASLNMPPAQPAAEAQPADPHAAMPAGSDAVAEQARSDLTATQATAERGAARRAAPALVGSSETAQRQRQEPEDLKVERPGPRADARQAAELPAAFQAVMEQVSLPVTQARALTGESSPKVDMAAAAQALSGATPLAERPAAEMAAPTVVHVATPADAPEFPQALGAQLSVFAKEGVQQAELHLNPADMGPISVQIALDGDQAKVDFGADSAITRQIIESGLPELAAALRDAGFTLSGGGVHSQAQQQGQRDREGGQPGHVPGRQGSGDEPAAVASPATRTVRAGGVDLYA